MKYFLFVLSALFLLASCESHSAPVPSADITQPSHSAPVVQPVSGKQPQKPDLDALNEGDGEYDVDISRVVDLINEDLDRPTVSADDIERGWYYGGRDDKKFGTPDSWQWIDDEERSRWARQGIVEEFIAVESDQWCKRTAGTYAYSCLDRDIDGCEYILESECRCLEGTQWVDAQGCILLDDEGELAEISLQNLDDGFYLGLPNEKKLNTPSDWQWEDLGKESRWFKPLPEVDDVEITN